MGNNLKKTVYKKINSMLFSAQVIIAAGIPAKQEVTMIKGKIVKALAVGGLAAALFMGCATTSSSKDMKNDTMMKEGEMSSASKKNKDGDMKNDNMMQSDMDKKDDGMMKDMK